MTARRALFRIESQIKWFIAKSRCDAQCAHRRAKIEDACIECSVAVTVAR
eukprot:CAMPEP_0181215000 /NCGR_PEP_ID=MMETSP1096-20121128/25773_1 /TAXON_ID=156174 ORGANISM="Chrysochromulina ericina, Strain CCMP281" /NCGR_SAMPLE_ID=MMETSP1096 /ASSEMBLY_ACC=CAM_ASM_000453 /LENGTH=49 /DNA_ID=CAMNT_0023306813 /DNA_START=1633 /DNA_END=1782 /DNA_ORIENTATION=-